jgi:hypothetical protein
MFGNTKYLSFKNLGGSVQHYYHFMLGFMVPLVLRMEQEKSQAKPSKSAIRSCGPMDRHLRVLNYPNLEIISPFKHKVVTSGVFKKFVAGETLSGFDHYDHYDQSVFREAAKIIKARLGVKAGVVSNQSPKVIAINRSVDHFYNSRHSEKKTSGNQRRSIPNFGDLEKHLASTCPDFKAVVLENTSLADQIELFQPADVIIAQHGAALVNILFARPGTKIIEIAPPQQPLEYFSRLAECLGLNYCCYHQAGVHADVDPQAIAALLN